MIKVWKSAKDGQWYVSHNGKNGEILSSSEGLKTRANALKNIRATMKIYGVEAVDYFDETKKTFYALYLTKADLASGRKAGVFS